VEPKHEYALLQENICFMAYQIRNRFLTAKTRASYVTHAGTFKE